MTVCTFPIDKLPEANWKIKPYMFVNHILKNMLWVKCGYGTEEMKRRWSYKIVKAMAAPFFIPSLKKWRKNWITKNDAGEERALFSSDYPKVRRKKEWYRKRRLYEFEDTSFYGPEDADSYLKAMFGTYMEMPPESERKKHTDYPVYFGRYEHFKEEVRMKKYDMGITVGVFDCLHEGHLNLFERCKEFCEHLIGVKDRMPTWNMDFRFLCLGAYAA